MVRDTYKWDFNTDVVEVFVPRLVDAGWLKPNDPETTPTTYTIILPKNNVDIDIEARVNKELRSLANEFKIFSEEISPLTKIPKAVEEFEDILIEWLLYVEAFSEKNIDFETQDQVDADGTLIQVMKTPKTTSLSLKEIFLCALFVEEAIRSKPETSERLARIASIGLLTEVIQDFVKPTTRVETSKLVVYLDAPVAMDLLGVSGLSSRENTLPLVNELIKIGAQVRVYGQSLDEIKRNLKPVLQNPRAFGPTANALTRNEILPDFVAQVAANPEPFLAKLGVAVTHRTLDHFPSEHNYFPNTHRMVIYDSLRFQKNNQAREHDADVTTFVVRQRRGTNSQDIFRSHFVLITRNGLLAELVKKRCVDLGVISRKSIPPVVHRRFLTASMWLRTGLGNQDLEVPKRMLLATCERVLAIRPGVVQAVKELTDALGDEEKTRQLDLLIGQHRSAQMLMDKTLGTASVVTEDNLAELFQEMLYPHLESERQRGQQAVKDERKKSEEKVRHSRKELEESKKSKEITKELLYDKIEEDKDTIEALCKEIEIYLKIRRNLKRFFGASLALALCFPIMLEPSGWQAWCSLAATLPLAYLTITGSSIIGITTSEESAISLLCETAERRRMRNKMSQFKICWQGTIFTIGNKTADQTRSV